MRELLLGFPRIDLHIHSGFSDGEGGIIDILGEAEKKNLDFLALTDHHTNTGLLDRYQYVNDADKVKSMRMEIEKANRASKAKMFLGVEADVVDLDGCLNVDKEILDEVDFVTASVHIIPGVELNWERIWTKQVNTSYEKIVEKCVECEINILNSGQVDVLAHPLFVPSIYINSIEEIPTELINEFVDAAAERKVALEINSGWVRLKSFQLRPGYAKFFSTCLKKGARISIGSDAHSLKDVGNTHWSYSILESINAESKDLFIPTSR